MTKTKKLLLSLTLSAFAAISVLFAFSVKHEVRAQTIVVDATCSAEINDNYDYGTELVLPSASATYNGKTVEFTEKTVIFPDGRAYDADSVTLNLVGKYTVVYSVKDGNNIIKSEKTFSVVKNMFTVETDKSECVFADKVGFKPSDQSSGLSVKLYDGDTFTFNTVFNIGDFGADKPFIKLYPHNRTKITKADDGTVKYEYSGESQYLQAERIVITLTDAYDPSVYVTFSMRYVTGETLYYSAGASGQVRSGLYETSRNPAYAKDKQLYYFDGKEYVARFTDTGTNCQSGWAYYGLSWYYDVDSSKVYTDDYSKMLVTVLNDKSLYKNNSFAGFTTGEVVLSITGENIYDEYFEFDIASVGGISGDALKNISAADTSAPVIDIDFRGGSDEAIIAKGETFKLFSATAQDVNLVGDAEVAVYYMYGTESQSQIAVADGQIKPNKSGLYTAVYTATDSFGNKREKLVKLNCAETANGKNIAFTTTTPTQFSAGVTGVLPEYSIVGNNGKVDVKIYASIDGEKTQIDPETREFTPKKAGVYTIEFIIGDFTQTYTESYELTCVTSDAVLLASPVTNPKYFIKGALYSLDKVYVNTFKETNPVSHLTNVYASFDGGDYVETNYDEFNVKANTSVKLKYTYDKWLTVTDDIPVVDVNFGGVLKTKNYFYGEDFDKAAEDELVYTVKNAGTKTLEFINPVSFENFVAEFKIPSGADSYSSVKITVTDYANEDNRSVIEFVKGNGKYVMSVDGNIAATVDKTWSGSNLKIFRSTAFGGYLDNNGNALKTSFAPSTDKVFFSVTLCDAKVGGKINLVTLNNQTLSVLRDNSGPSVVAEQNTAVRNLGDVVTIKPAQAIDVFTPVLVKTIKTSVKAPNNAYATAEDGTVLDGNNDAFRNYDIKFTQYGTYRVNYEASDQNGNVYQLAYIIQVADTEKPQIVLSGDATNKKFTSAKVGKEVKVAGYTVSDNVSATDKISVLVTVVSPKDEMRLVKNGAFTADSVGEWKVLYYCVDEAGNGVTVSYTVTIK